MKSLPVSMLRELLDHDPDTGVLTWKVRPLHYFDSEARRRAWNDQWAGKRALNTPDTKGYLRGPVRNVKTLAHRVCFAIHHGRWPVGEVDHINGDPADNRIINLREVTHTENMRNTPLLKNSSTGCVGVSRYRRNGRWRAHIKVGGKQRHLGCFSSKAEAIAARRAAQADLGFHENHGRPAR